MQFQRLAKFIWVIAMGLGITGLTACSTVSNFFWPPGKALDWKGVTIAAASQANLNTAVAVDLVLLMDESILPAVSTMPSTKWFATRADLIRTYPKAVKSLNIEITPGQTIKLTPESLGSERVMGAFIFADYLTPGEHRVRVDTLSGQIFVELGERAFAASAVKP